MQSIRFSLRFLRGPVRYRYLYLIYTSTSVEMMDLARAAITQDMDHKSASGSLN